MFTDDMVDRLAKHLAAKKGIEEDMLVYEGGPFEWTAWRDDAREYLAVALAVDKPDGELDASQHG